MSLLEIIQFLQNNKNGGPEEDRGFVCGVKT